MKHMGLTAALTLAILAGATVSDANAQGDQKGPRMSFEEVDANADGKLTPEEMQAHRRAQMAKMDSDTDGFLTEAELRAGMQSRSEEKIERRIGHMMKRFDADGDGKVAIEDIKPRKAGKMFDRADADGDGAISKDEFEAMKAKRKNKG